MDLQQTIAWFDELSAKVPPTGRNGTVGIVALWATHAQAALEATFPVSHAVRTNWRDAMEMPEHQPYEQYNKTQRLISIFQVAHDLLKAGRLSNLLESVRTETTTELMDQASVLNHAGYAIAAAVIAGGALETHLLHLCNRYRVTWNGDGSISKYNDAIAQARNAGNEIYSASDWKMVTAWGGRRNDAAHEPTSFSATESEVRTMIDGIRQFVSKTA